MKDLIRGINDPEHPLSLEQLNVVSLDQITISSCGSKVQVLYTPTIPHCSMATLIGLCIRIQLRRMLPPQCQVIIEGILTTLSIDRLMCASARELM